MKKKIENNKICLIILNVLCKVVIIVFGMYSVVKESIFFYYWVIWKLKVVKNIFKIIFERKLIIISFY